MNNRFVQIGKYKVLEDWGDYQYCGNTIREIVDMKTGIIYMNNYFSNGDYCTHQMQPMLYDNGKPQHFNKEELLKIKMMIERLDFARSVTEYEYDSYEQLINHIKGDWTLEEIYNEVFPDYEDRKAYEIDYMEELNSK